MSNSYKNGAFALGVVVGGGITLNLVLWSAYPPIDKITDPTAINGNSEAHPTIQFWDWLINTFITPSDSIAQWAMAALSLAAVFLLWWTLQASRATLKVSQDMANETTRIGEAQVKPYLGFDVKSGNVIAGQPIQFQIDITNYGASPAFDFACASTAVIRNANWTWESEKSWDDGNSPVGEEIPSHYLHPKGRMTVYIDTDPPTPLSDHHIAALRSGESVIFARAQVYFRDVFSKPNSAPRTAQIMFEFSGYDCFKTKRVRMSSTGNYST